MIPDALLTFPGWIVLVVLVSAALLAYLALAWWALDLVVALVRRWR